MSRRPVRRPRSCEPQLPFGQSHSPRGRISCTNRPVAFGRLEIGGNHPIVVAYVKTGSAKHRKQFRFLCRVNGVQTQEVQAFGGDYLTAFECWGSAESVDRVVSDDCVKDWHPVLDVRVPFVGTGTMRGSSNVPRPPRRNSGCPTRVTRRTRPRPRCVGVTCPPKKLPKPTGRRPPGRRRFFVCPPTGSASGRPVFFCPLMN